jgi:uncharacterized SAM-binding protein YcdF (DUF218 family)
MAPLKALRLFLTFFAFLILVAVLTFIALNVYIKDFNTRNGKQESPTKANAIMVLGCQVRRGMPAYSELVLRLEAALLLYQEGLAPSFIVSGGRGEAEAMRDYLIAHKVNPEVIFTENQSTTTWENMSFSLPILNKLKIQSLIIVSSPSHLARINLVAQRLNYPPTQFFANNFSYYGVQREVVALPFYFIFKHRPAHLSTTTNVS